MTKGVNEYLVRFQDINGIPPAGENPVWFTTGKIKQRALEIYRNEQTRLCHEAGINVTTITSTSSNETKTALIIEFKQRIVFSFQEAI